ncbi:SLAM family member 6 [Lepus europaeus]|uniref:SLAM family member 6 n=1 Tax=Lepus europaeus TaxID=9983 RepID=UPI002B488DD4|nr:SLAM family member 6 [Lepus europaeus]
MLGPDWFLNQTVQDPGARRFRSDSSTPLSSIIYLQTCTVAQNGHRVVLHFVIILKGTSVSMSQNLQSVPRNVVSQSSSTPLVVNGILWEPVTLPLQLPAKELVMIITWLHNGASIAVVQPSAHPRILVTNPAWQKRVNFTQSYSLCLNNLTEAEVGSYSAQMTTENSVIFSNYTLRIFRRLRNLQITSHAQLSENRTCEIHLTCSVENPNDNAWLRWQTPGNTSLSEPNLTISWDPRNASEHNYTCIAETPANNLSLTVSARGLCEGIFNKENERWDFTWIIITAPLISIIIIVGIIFWCSLHLSTQQTHSPVESMWNLEYTSGSPGSTVYAQVTHPSREKENLTPVKNNESVTIYSTVNHSKERYCNPEDSKFSFYKASGRDSLAERTMCWQSLELSGPTLIS